MWILFVIRKSEYKESCCSVIKVPGVEACGRHGVEITFNVAAQAASFVQVKIPPSLASARMKGAIAILIVISVYDPTLDVHMTMNFQMEAC